MEPAGCVFVAGSAPRCTRSGSRDVDSIVSRLLACRLLNSTTLLAPRRTKLMSRAVSSARRGSGFRPAPGGDPSRVRGAV